MTENKKKKKQFIKANVKNRIENLHVHTRRHLLSHPHTHTLTHTYTYVCARIHTYAKAGYGAVL